ncbi:hypothetical protein CXP43_16270 [Bacillus velezensis]|uniref:hypothetical protein n=1 Tax=Bacillus velezensis TaxID=492670 RepID=UPI000C6DA1DF|nr:hypothetical protein [Bacillus velezensis]AUG37191.1 hypothetical protein CXP43_16270 [Bacillus velezensis]QRL10391.1 hypothetical protein GKO36_16235 [Bacillus velezensis]
MKPTITKEQAEAIEFLRSLDAVSDEWFLFEYADVYFGGEPDSPEFGPIADMNIMTLAAALINGYAVEATPEDRVREYFAELQEKQRDAQSRGVTFSLECEREGVINTLNLLGIKIEGVNAR